ncbi:MAG: hypothetical protein J6Y01_02175, partial [Spirochaetales bacterium]|nr:hypothetical protein [Spirochaetales bacterium]
YAAANGYGIMLSGSDFASVKIPAEYKDLPADKWNRNTFVKDTTYYHWDFSDKLQGSGIYNIKFTYNYGAEKLVLKDALIIADGKVITRYIGEVSAGHSPRQIVYTVLLPNGAKKLELIAANTRNASTDTNGVIELVKETFEQEDIAKIGAKIIAESQNAASTSITGWGKDDFTSSDTQRKWDFTSSIKGSGD